MENGARPADPLISVVVPVHNEAGSIEELARRVGAVFATHGTRYELLFVDDGSDDATAAVLERLKSANPSLRQIRFTRSFGHQAALTAGIRFARGDAVITMDGDLQHPPETIPALLSAWREGAAVVHTRRVGGDATAGAKERASRLFYWTMNKLSNVPVVAGGADFRLLDRRAVDAFNELEEHFVFTRGLVPWLGFRATQIEYAPGPRHAGESKFTLRRQLQLGLNGIFSFSVAPLRLIAVLGLGTTSIGILYGIYVVVQRLSGRAEAAGWASIAVLILIFGGVQLFSLGIVSEYIGRTYEEVKRRPRYVIEAMDDGESENGPPSADR